MHHLGRVEELLAAVDHVPLAVQPDVDHQRHQRVQDLRDAAAERGRRDVQDPLALQPLGALADLVDQRPADDARVIGEVLVADGDGLEHGRGLAATRPARRRADARRLAHARRLRVARSPASTRRRSQLARAELRIGGRDRGHLELVAGAEQPVAVERRAPAVGDDAAGLAQAQPRRGEVVGRVVEHLPAADALELARASRARRRSAASRPRPRRRAGR